MLLSRWFLTLPLLLLLGISPISGAAEDDKREVKVSLSQSKAVIESARKATGKEDQLKLEFDSGSHNFNFEYESEDADQHLDAKIKVELFDLIEWRDTNRNGLYDPAIPEELVQKIGLGDLVPQSLTSRAIEVEGVKGVEVIGMTAAPAKYPDLGLTLTLRMFGEFLKLEDTSLEPTSMKFDVRIQGFPWQKGDSSLALYVKVVMQAEEEAELEMAGEELVGARAGKYIAFFSWGNTVSVDGQPATVKQAVVKHEEKQDRGESDRVSELYLLYSRGEDILHDPKLGVFLAKPAGGCNRLR